MRIISSRIALRFFFVVMILLLAGRLYLPYFLKAYVNKVLNRMPDYKGSVGDIEVALYRGAYRINDFKLLKRTGKISEPYIASPAVDLSIQWNALLHGRLVGEVELEGPELNIIRSESAGNSQTGMKKDWTDVVGDLFPTKINRVAVTNGKVTYRHQGPQDEVALIMTKIQAEALNLTNEAEKEGELPSRLTLQAAVQKSAHLQFDMRMAPLAKAPTFDADLKLSALSLVEINTLLRKGIGVDAEGGQLSIFAEAASNKQGFKGYVKPIAKNVSLVSLKNDSGPLGIVWEGLVSAVIELFTNQKHDQFATEIPFSGSWERPESDIWSALSSILSNAFYKALPSKLNKSIGFSENKALNRQR